MKIIKARACDLDIIADFENNYFSHPYSKELIIKTLKNENYLIVIATKDGSPAGYAEFGYFIDSVSVDRVCVSYGFRRQGIAKMLLAEGEKWAKRLMCNTMTLEVRSQNLAAVALYEKSGYILCSRRSHYYTCPKDDALIYTKLL